MQRRSPSEFHDNRWNVRVLSCQEMHDSVNSYLHSKRRVLHLHPDVASISTKVEIHMVSEGGSCSMGPVQNDLEVESTDYVIVCDICGDVGREDLLAICSTCKDGAEHTYCMKLMINEVPMGDWQCEECKSSEECQMFEVLNEGNGRIPKTSSEEVQTKEKPKEFADEQETNWWQEYEMNWWKEYGCHMITPQAPIVRAATYKNYTINDSPLWQMQLWQ
ncbi:hypothetical protein L2E82_22984 [Cichorium intybus]|uniref:Uncharacterized protein n=1 Tax=Cichorium intybus TaxID=13427 RepID=A0ACB9DZA7_CICIN|nr:hypothetical protein L2E82_22984 [Cichorium intybus]